MPKFLFPNGTAVETGAYVIVQVMHENGKLLDGNLYADYRFNTNPEGFATDWTAVSICYSERANVVYAAGANGEIVRISDTEHAEEFIAPTENGPAVQGPIREIRVIGSDLYAVGMGRQVYQRIERRWERIDEGVLDTSGRITAGLTSITGDGNGFLVAVGYDGEIWEFHEAWTEITSPTNLLLTRVISHDGKYYAAGLHGVVLCRELSGWRVIDTGGFERDIWDLETFRGTLYLGTTQGLFWMTPDEEIKPVDPATFTRQVHCASLSAGRDRLWCFGAEIVSSTADGTVWREEAVF
jgi:hypothetical protein